MATTVYAKQKGLNAGLGFSGNFNSGFSPFTTGTLVINDVSPLPGRTTGATASIAQQESISRQYASTTAMIEARAAADKTMGDEYKVA